MPEETADQSVLSYSPKIGKQVHTVSIDTKTLLKIEEVKLQISRAFLCIVLLLRKNH